MQDTMQLLLMEDQHVIQTVNPNIPMVEIA